MSPVHQVWPKPSCKAQWKGEEDKADTGRGGKTTPGNGQALSSPSTRGQWRTGENGGNWLRNHLWCPNDPDERETFILLWSSAEGPWFTSIHWCCLLSAWSSQHWSLCRRLWRVCQDAQLNLPVLLPLLVCHRCHQQNTAVYRYIDVINKTLLFIDCKSNSRYKDKKMYDRCDIHSVHSSFTHGKFSTNAVFLVSPVPPERLSDTWPPILTYVKLTWVCKWAF